MKIALSIAAIVDSGIILTIKAVTGANLLQSAGLFVILSTCATLIMCRAWAQGAEH